MSAKFEKVKNITIPDDDLVSFKTMGNLYEVCYVQFRNTNPIFPIKRLDKDTYLNVYTSEVKEYKHINNRSENKQQLSKTFKRIREYINTNVVDIKKCKWITLTYRENMTDTKRLYLDNDKFIKKFRYKYGKVEYIMVCEPQGRGAWHSHIIFIFDKTAPFIPNTEIEKLWGHGFTKTKKVDKVNNLGVYFTAYLGDMELEEVKSNGIEYDTKDIREIKEIDGIVLDKPKYFVKGARLSLYPPKFNILRRSRGIKPPTKETITYSEAKEKVGFRRPTYSETIKLTTDTNFTNIIKYENYNSKERY